VQNRDIGSAGCGCDVRLCIWGDGRLHWSCDRHGMLCYALEGLGVGIGAERSRVGLGKM
jgi:hypothetical protein